MLLDFSYILIPVAVLLAIRSDSESIDFFKYQNYVMIPFSSNRRGCGVDS